MSRWMSSQLRTFDERRKWCGEHWSDPYAYVCNTNFGQPFISSVSLPLVLVKENDHYNPLSYIELVRKKMKRDVDLKPYSTGSCHLSQSIVLSNRSSFVPGSVDFPETYSCLSTTRGLDWVPRLGPHEGDPPSTFRYLCVYVGGGWGAFLCLFGFDESL